MNYSFEYVDIILLAMIAGFIFLRLRGILGKRTGFEGKSPAQFKEVLKNIKIIPINEAKAILEYALVKPINPLNLTESEILQAQKPTIIENNLKENLTH